MLIFGIDVVIMLVVGIMCVIAVTVMALVMAFEQSTGWACIITCTMTSLVFVVSYVIMAYALDATLGTYGW